MMNKLPKQISNDDLIQMLNDIYDWHNGNGDLPEGVFKNFLIQNMETYKSATTCEGFVLNEAHDRFSKIAKVLFCDRPRIYIK